MQTPHKSPLLLVTGARGGIGSEVVAQALDRGWRVAAVSRRPADGSLASAGVLGLEVQADVSDAAGAALAFAAARDHFGEAPSLVCHAAGNIRLGGIERCTDEQWRQVMAANLDSAFYVLRAYALARGEVPGGAALVFSSAAARMGTTGHGAVAAAKAGVEGLVRALAADWSPRGWRINGLALGMSETPMTESFTRSERSRQTVTLQYPLLRLGRAAEIADWSLRLLDAEGWMTGQILSLDGGFSSVRPLVRPSV